MQFKNYSHKINEGYENLTERNQLKIKKLLHDCVLVKPFERKFKTKADIVMADAYKKHPMEGVVVSTGPGLVNEKSGKLMPITVKAGDHIHFFEYAGEDIYMNGVYYLLMKESIDILAIVPHKPKGKQ